MAGTRRDLHILLDILRAATTTASFFESKLRFELAGHDDAVSPGFTDIRIGDSLTEAEVHGLYSLWPVEVSLVSNDYDNRYQLSESYAPPPVLSREEERREG